MNIWIACVLGLISGHILRRLSPTLLRMKDRTMPFKLPWLEVTTALGAALLAWRFPELMAFLPWFIMLLFMMAFTATDMQAKLIPPEVTWLGTIVALIANGLQPDPVLGFMNQGSLLAQFGLPLHPPLMAGILVSVAGALAGGILMEFIRRVFSRMVSMEVMGFGDTLIMMMIGAFIGPKLVIISLFPACLIGVIMGVVHRMLFDVPHTPFGPALAGGGLLTLVFHDLMVKGIEGYQTMLRQLSGSALTVFSLGLLLVAVFLIWRIRKKRDEYEQQIEDDYQKIEEQIES